MTTHGKEEHSIGSPRGRDAARRTDATKRAATQVRFGKRVVGPQAGRRPSSVALAREMASRLGKVRRKLGFTHRQFADRIGRDEKNTKRWFQGRKPDMLSPELLVLLAERMGVSPNYVLLGIGAELLPGRLERTRGTRSSPSSAATKKLIDFVVRRTGYDRVAVMQLLPSPEQLELLLARAIEEGLEEGLAYLRRVNRASARRSEDAALLRMQSVVEQGVNQYASQESERALEAQRGDIESRRELADSAEA